jgi:hypothetical protein
MFPVVRGATFKDHTDQGPFRAVFVYTAPVNDNINAYYCGTIYHEGDDFAKCDPKGNKPHLQTLEGLLGKMDM